MKLTEKDYLIFDEQVRQAFQYLLKKGNQGFEFWLKSKGFNSEEEKYIRSSLGYEND